MRDWVRRLTGVGGSAAPSILSVVLSLLVCWIAIALTKGDAGVAAEAYGQMLWGGIGDFPAWSDGAPWTALTRPWGESAVKLRPTSHWP